MSPTDIISKFVLICLIVFIGGCSFTRSDAIDTLFPARGTTSTELRSLLESNGILSNDSSFAEIQKAAGNTTETEYTKAHRYLMSVLAEMMALEWSFMGSHKEPSVVAVFPVGMSGTGLNITDHMTLMFNLSQSISRGLDSVTAAEIVLLRNPKLQEKFSHDQTFQLKLTVCNDTDNKYNYTYIRELRKNGRQMEVFNMTDIFRQHVREAQQSMKLVLSVIGTATCKQGSTLSERKEKFVGNQTTTPSGNLDSTVTGNQTGRPTRNQSTTPPYGKTSTPCNVEGSTPSATGNQTSTPAGIQGITVPGNHTNAHSINQKPLLLNDTLILLDPEQGPILIVYHNMQPLDIFERRHNLSEPSFFNTAGNREDNIGDGAGDLHDSGGHDVSEVDKLEGSSNSSFSYHRRRRQIRRKGLRSVNLQASSNIHCDLHMWTVDFHADLRWTWIKYPTSVKLNFCSGICPSPIQDKEINSTNNAFIRDQFNVITKWQHPEIPLLSCVPIKLAPVDVYYVTAKNDHVIKRLPDVIIQACACL